MQGVMVGDLVAVRFPRTDQQPGKPRPALVLADVSAPGMDDWIACQITTNRRPGDILIALSDVLDGSLRRDSWARPGRLLTLESGQFTQTIGRLTDAKLAEVLAAVRALF